MGQRRGQVCSLRCRVCAWALGGAASELEGEGVCARCARIMSGGLGKVFDLSKNLG